MAHDLNGNNRESAIARRIREAGKRAIAETEKRRKSVVRSKPPVEIGGRDGLEPTRFGDWEKDGIVTDF